MEIEHGKCKVCILCSRVDVLRIAHCNLVQNKIITYI
jgi:hypothetical protein